MNHHKYKYSCIAGLLGAVTLFTACGSVKQTSAAGANEKVVFFDDFAGNKLDNTKWNVEVTGMHFNNELQAYVDSSATIFIAHGTDAEGAANGALVLQPRSAPGFKTRDGQNFDFISGRINTKSKFEFTYGTAEARIKLTEGSGLWPAWWMLGTNGEWPACGEIDIMEYVGEKDWVSAAVHGPGYSGETPFVNRQYFAEGKDVTAWHTYAVDWTPDSLLFKYDGVLMFRINRHMVEHYGKWAYDTPQFLMLNYALGGGYPVKINGVKAPYFGMPQSSADLVKNNKVKMLVDWVKVTKRSDQEK